jgi:hypothetical protein
MDRDTEQLTLLTIFIALSLASPRSSPFSRYFIQHSA